MNQRSKRPTPADLAPEKRKQMTVDESDALYHQWLHHRPKEQKRTKAPQA